MFLLNAREKNILFPCALFVCACIISTFTFTLSTGEDYLRGYDAYYYAVQSDALVKTGKLRIPDSSIVLYGIGFLQWMGMSAETALRLWVTGSQALFAGTLLLFLSQLRSKNLTFILFCWGIASPSLVYLAIEFPKNFAVLIIMNIWFWLLCRPKRNWILLLLSMALAVLCHRMALVYVGLIMISLSAKHMLPHAFLAQIRKNYLTLIGIIVLCGILGYYLSHVIGWHDLSRLKNTHIIPGVISLFSQPNLPRVIRTEIIFSALALIDTLYLYNRQRKEALSTSASSPESENPLSDKNYGEGKKSEHFSASMSLENNLIVPFFLIISSFIPAFGTEPLSLGERFGLAFPYCTLIACAWILRDIAFNLKKRTLILAGCAGLGTAYIHNDYAYLKPTRQPHEHYKYLIDELKHYEIPMLILHRGIHFYYKYNTGREAFSYEPEQHWNKLRVWRLVYGLSPEELFTYAPNRCRWNKEIIALSNKPHALVREDCFTALRAAIKATEHPELYALLWHNALNPSQKRPVFLYKKHINDTPDEFSALPEETKQAPP